MGFVEDLRGSEVRVGDEIAYAVTVGRSGNLRIGTVVEIVDAHESFERWDKDHEYPNKVPTKLRVQVEKSAFGSLYSDKPTLIDATFKRFVRLTPSPPSAEYCTSIAEQDRSAASDTTQGA